MSVWRFCQHAPLGLGEVCCPGRGVFLKEEKTTKYVWKLRNKLPRVVDCTTALTLGPLGNSDVVVHLGFISICLKTRTTLVANPTSSMTMMSRRILHFGQAFFSCATTAWRVHRVLLHIQDVFLRVQYRHLGVLVALHDDEAPTWGDERKLRRDVMLRQLLRTFSLLLEVLLCGP